MKRLWKSQSFGPILRDAAHGSTPDLCLWMYNNLDVDLESTFSSFLHSTEKHAVDSPRIKLTAREGAISPYTSPMSTMQSRQHARNIDLTALRSAWRPPRPGELRLDVDSFVDDDDDGSNRFGVGGVVRDSRGDPILAFGRELTSIEGVLTSIEGKLRAIKEGLDACHVAGVFPSVVCSDSVLAVRAVTGEGGRRMRSRVDSVSMEIRRLLESTGNGATRLEFAIGSSNSVARAIAKFASVSRSECVWVAGEFPSWLQELVHVDTIHLSLLD